MRKLGDLTAHLSQGRRHFEDLLQKARASTKAPASSPRSVPSRLHEVSAFGSNPGRLRMFAYVPADLPPNAPLVVVLHGCTQSAAAYDHGAGWSTLADRHGFALVLPEQQPANNPKVCFSWFQPGDTARDRGETLSIRQMVEQMLIVHRLDRGRVFITGLSAGGAMTAALLAAYPDVFCAGAIIAGLPYGSAANVQEAFQSMFQGQERPARHWGDEVRAASSHAGPWPRVSIWHGSADPTVKPGNARELVKQWTNLHGLPPTPTHSARVAGHPYSAWTAADGTVLVESYTIAGMAHGTPLAIAGALDPHGAPGPFMLDVGIASSHHIATFFGIAPATDEPRRADGTISAAIGASRRALVTPSVGRPEARPRLPAAPASPPLPPSVSGGVEAIIKDALRAAGLLKNG
jgi:poly(hydroxyalkanoate) depolymerase family esterase